MRSFQDVFRAVLASVLLVTVPGSGMRAEEERVGPQRAERKALLFRRSEPRQGQRSLQFLEAAFFENGQVRVRTLHEFDRHRNEFRPLGVHNAKVYALTSDRLVVLDLERGSLELVKQFVDMMAARPTWYFSAPYFYHFVRDGILVIVSRGQGWKGGKSNVYELGPAWGNEHHPACGDDEPDDPEGIPF